MKNGEEDSGGGDFGIVSSIRQFRGGAKIEDFVQVASKGGQRMLRLVLLSYKCKTGWPAAFFLPAPANAYTFRLSLRCCAR
jgi:hypothetical protein